MILESFTHYRKIEMNDKTLGNELQLTRGMTYFFLLLIIFCSCENRPVKDPLIRILEDIRDTHTDIIENKKEYGFQLIYTQINRDEINMPHLQSWFYNVDKDNYFYPASTVKLPSAILALEKINMLDVPGLSKVSTMYTDSSYSGQTSVYHDSSSRSFQPSVAHYIKKIFLVSDNDAFNRLYEFLGQEYLHETLKSKGFTNTGIVHRLSLFLSEEENRHTNPIRFLNADTLVYFQTAKAGKSLFPERKEVLLGEGYVTGDSLVQDPMNFTRKNFISLEDLHNMLLELIFPGILHDKPLFHLTDEDYRFLYTYMSMYPRESEYPDYGSEFNDNYCKFLMFADHEDEIPGHVRIFNKIGLAYGFLIETAYIIDTRNKVEFFLSAVLNVNRNKIYNDGIYAYDSLGFPFMADLGRAVYNYELKRPRKHTPDLSRFELKY
jgi:hypothetical protein